MLHNDSFINQEDLFYMRKTLLLAKRGAGKTSPNPMVGAIIVKDGREIGAGFHIGPGHPHAEVVALSKASYQTQETQASHLSRGGTLYTNLEPCCHTEKRTPPCTQSIIKSGIARVVIAMEDPNPRVQGKGIKQLCEAGIAVTTGVLKSPAMRLNEYFVKYMTTQKPFVILKTGMTLDGRVATPAGESKWITGEKARQEARRLRSRVDAVLVGIGTVLADDPGLLAHPKEGYKNPLRVVIDPSLKISLSSQLMTSSQKAATLVCTLIPTSSPKIQELQQRGIQVLSFSGEKECPWDSLLETLGKMNILSLLIEGGGNVNGRALRSGIVDKIIFYIAPKLFCGNDAHAVADGAAFRSLADAIEIGHLNYRRVGADLCVEGYCKSSPLYDVGEDS